MLNLWTSLNWPQALLLGAALVAFFTGAAPVLIRRVGILLGLWHRTFEDILAAVWPSFRTQRSEKLPVHPVAQRRKDRAA